MEGKDKQKRGMGENYRIWVQEGIYRDCAFCRALVGTGDAERYL